MRYVFRQQRELEDPDFVYSDEDVDDMLTEAKASGSSPMPPLEELFEEALRPTDAFKQP